MENNAYVMGDFFEYQEEFYRKLVDISMEKKLKEGEILLAGGENFTGFYLLKAGTLAGTITTMSGRQKILHLITSRTLIGASSIDQRPSSVEYRCFTDVTAGYIPRESFSGWTNEMLLSFAQIQTYKLRGLMRQIEYARYYTTEERILMVISEFENIAAVNPGSRLRAEGGVKKQLLCDILGITNVRLSQLLGRMEKQGKISMTRSCVFRKGESK